ncbi:MAG: hypothetical protein LBJ02_02470 [Bifidobacteriaceae bacterium]|nr:hypothetical protein [Bifidobacteriaceae bacterium]
MKTELKRYTVREIARGFVYNEYEGKRVFALSGRLVIQPEYQRNYIYNDSKKDVAAEQVTASPNFAALVTELRRLDAAGANPPGLLSRAAPHIEGVENPSGALARIVAATKLPRGGTNPRKPRLIAGLIP